MNIHHLELFYYVARHGGISEAVRNIPYGIQQPAVSAQIILLEDALGAKLFQRRPFQLTDAGEKLHAFITPFFGNLGRVEEEIRGRAAQFIRLGASGTVLRQYFPELLLAVRRRIPGLKVSLHDATVPQLLPALELNELDLAVTVLQGKPPAGLRAAPLLTLPLILFVPADSKLRNATELWRRDKIEEPLIALPAAEPMMRNFQQGLATFHADWPPTFVVNSLDLIETYVAKGFGMGVSVEAPGMKPPAGVRCLPLEGFNPVEICVLWAGKPTPLMKLFVEEMQTRARALAKGG